VAANPWVAGQPAPHAANIPARADRLIPTVTSVHWALPVLVGCGLPELPSLGFGLVETVFARPMRAEDGRLHSSLTAAGIAEEFHLARWQSAAVPEEVASTSSAQCSSTALKNIIVTPLTSPGVKAATSGHFSHLHALI